MVTFGKSLMLWYEENGRPLPWRNTKNPYYIWLSEVILQQTQVKRGLSYYQKFLKHYPSVFELAAASEQDILKDWEGLGYYTRARTLHQTAKVIVEDYKGFLPTTYSSLIKLKGIGEYTGAAIASFCFDEKIAVLDGNVFRVLARVFGIEEPINTSKGKKIFLQQAKNLLPEKASLYNQAIMEFGAIHCTYRKPKCPICIFKTSCYAYKNQQQHLLPKKNKPKSKKVRYFYYLLIKYEDKTLIQCRQSQDIWKGLYQFYLIEKDKPEDVLQLLDSFSNDKNILIENIYPSYTHVLTHQHLYLTFIELAVNQQKQFESLAQELKLIIYDFNLLSTLPFPIPLIKFLKEQKNKSKQQVLP